jgi:hypothetical protein
MEVNPAPCYQAVRTLGRRAIHVAAARTRVESTQSGSFAVSRFGRARGAGSPWLVLVREPDLLGIERADSPLSFVARLVQFTGPHRCIATDDDWTFTGLDHHDL